MLPSLPHPPIGPQTPHPPNYFLPLPPFLLASHLWTYAEQHIRELVCSWANVRSTKAMQSTFPPNGWKTISIFVGVQVDIYSFGVLLWELVTATPPIRGRLRPIKVSAYFAFSSPFCATSVKVNSCYHLMLLFSISLFVVCNH